jgi:hypothetical protein
MTEDNAQPNCNNWRINMASRKDYDNIINNAGEARERGAMNDKEAQDYIRDKVKEASDKGKK